MTSLHNNNTFSNPMFSIGDFLQGIMDFEAYVGERDFIKIFGKSEGAMLWNAYKDRCGSNTTLFYRILDDRERSLFEKYLLSEPIAKAKNIA